MKTSSKFNKVINDAGKLALTEGHTVQSSSPRVSPCGLLSFNLKSRTDVTVKFSNLPKCAITNSHSNWVATEDDHNPQPQIAGSQAIGAGAGRAVGTLNFLLKERGNEKRISNQRM